VKETAMRLRPLWIGFVVAFALLALPRNSFACPT
jgi:hypothetical protein